MGSHQSSNRISRGPRAIFVAAVAIILVAPASISFGAEGAPELLIRTDDIGMSHTVNSALREFIGTGIPFSASVMVPCPWFLEAADILRDTPHASVGIHLTLNSEWADYKWGPVLGAAAVPSLVDTNGYFFETGAELLANEPDLGEVQAELRAQIERAKRAGLEIDYLDYHMLTAASTPEFRGIVESLAEEYGFGLSRYFGTPSLSLWDVEPDKKLVTLLDMIEGLEPGSSNLLVMHLGLETPEMKALIDANNPADPYRVAQHRQSELVALTSRAFQNAVEERAVQFITYRDLIERFGLDAMEAPESFGYSMNEQADD